MFFLFLSEVVVFDPHLARTPIVDIGHLSTNVKPMALNLDVFFGPDLNLDLHVKKTCQFLLLSSKKYS